MVLESSAKLSLGCHFGSPALAWHKIQEPLTQGANVLRGSGIKNTVAYMYMFCNIMISTHHVPPSTLGGDLCVCPSHNVSSSSKENRCNVLRCINPGECAGMIPCRLQIGQWVYVRISKDCDSSPGDHHS